MRDGLFIEVDDLGRVLPHVRHTIACEIYGFGNGIQSLFGLPAKPAHHAHHAHQGAPGNLSSLLVLEVVAECQSGRTEHRRGEESSETSHARMLSALGCELAS